MPDLDDENDPPDRVDGVDDAVVSLPHPISVGMTGQSFAGRRSGVAPQRLDAADQAPSIARPSGAGRRDEGAFAKVDRIPLTQTFAEFSPLPEQRSAQWGEPGHPQPAAEEAAELALDEARQADPVGARGGRGEEALQV
jgi:hypothetical protein